MHGRGELVLCEGEVYLGEFRNGFPNGRGIRRWKNEICMKETIQTAFNKAQVCLLAQHKAGNIKMSG